MRQLVQGRGVVLVALCELLGARELNEIVGSDRAGAIAAVPNVGPDRLRPGNDVIGLNRTELSQMSETGKRQLSSKRWQPRQEFVRDLSFVPMPPSVNTDEPKARFPGYVKS